MAGYGFRPYVINRSSPTPLMMFMVKTRAMPYGIAVMASHNPAIYNGIKVFTAGGRDADRTVTDKIESEIAQINPDTIKSMDYDAAVAAGVITEHNPTNEYIDSILSAIDVEAIKNAQLRIALDPMYGVSQTSLGMIFMTCRCDLEIADNTPLNSRVYTVRSGDTLSSIASRLSGRRCTCNLCSTGI